MNSSKKAFDLPFSWLFSIVAGAFIIFIAIYATVHFVNPIVHTQQSVSAQELLNYLNPVVNGITSAYATKVTFNKNTRIYFNCSTATTSSPFFGRESLAFSEESGLITKWPAPGEPVSRYNKYIFSNDIEQGKTFFIFSKPFYTGFRVDDLIFLSANRYCFIAPPESIADELSRLAIANINLTNTSDACSKDSIKVCFGSTFAGCNVSVYGTCNELGCNSEYDSGYITKQGKKINYFGSLIYAGIFSSPTIYECNVKRLGNKIGLLAKVYSEKIDVIKEKNCDSVIDGNLALINSYALALNGSLGLEGIYAQAMDMDGKNCEVSEDCRVYAPENNDRC